MAKYFREDEIEQFRESFFFNAKECKKERNKVPALLNVNELEGTLMSLGLVPTLYELRNHLQQYNSRVTFADFLEVIYKQKQREQIPEDIIEGFKAQDWKQKGKLPVAEVRFLLRYFGRGLSEKEVNQILSEGGVSSNDSHVKYMEFVEKFVGVSQRAAARDNELYAKPTPKAKASGHDHPAGPGSNFVPNTAAKNEPKPDY